MQAQGGQGMTAAAADLLPLAKSLARHANLLADGLEDGSAALYEAVTPTTAELLRWWFGEEAC